MKRHVVAMSATAMVASAVAAVPMAAQAASHAPSTKSATALDRCPGPASLCQDGRAVTTLARGTRLSVTCSTSGRGGTWLYVRTAGGKTGFVTAGAVKRAGSPPSCAGNRALTAALWATRADVWNRTQPTSAMAAKLKRAYDAAYDFGDSNDWSGDTRAFGALAYLANGSGYKLPLTNPIDTWKNYKSRGVGHTTGTPPAGALVFWHYKSVYGYEYGLLGISIGNRKAVTAPGGDSQKVAVTLKGTGKSLGWVLPY